MPEIDFCGRGLILQMPILKVKLVISNNVEKDEVKLDSVPGPLVLNKHASFLLLTQAGSCKREI